MNHSYPRVLSSCLSDGPVLGLAVVRCPSRTERPLRGRTANRLITPRHAIARIADARCSSRNRVDSTQDTPVGPESSERRGGAFGRSGAAALAATKACCKKAMHVQPKRQGSW